MFTKAGSVPVKIVETMLAEPKFAKGVNDFDVCVHVQSLEDPTQSDWWYGEWSDNYGKGVVSHLKQRELTMKTLRRIGFEGDDLSTLDQLVGKETVAIIKENPGKEGRVFFNVKALGQGADAPKAMDKDEIKRRLAALMGGGTGGPGDAAPQSSAPAAKPNPFGASAGPKKNQFGK